MSEPTFAQPERRNYIAPVLVLLVLCGIGAGFIYRKMARQTLTASVTQTIAHPVKIFYKAAPQSSSVKVLKVQEGEDDLYIVSTVRIENHLDVPMYLKDFTLTFDTAEGEMHTSAIEKNDLDAVYSSFPEIKPLMAKPLLRETSIAPGGTAEGTLLAQFAVPPSTWEQRKSATVTIDFYHAASMAVPIPKP